MSTRLPACSLTGARWQAAEAGALHHTSKYGKQVRRASHLLRLLTSVLCSAATAIVLLRGQSGKPDLSVPDSVLALHLTRVMKMLPEESGPPPFGDLTKDNPPGADRKWEARFTGSMGVRPIIDPGVHSLEEATSISLTTTEFVGQSPSFPVKGSAIVAIGVPIAAVAHLAQNGRFVYSLYRIRLEEVWKDHRKERKDNAANQVVCGELGGSLRFSSGHVGTFLEANDGFLKLGSRYVLFLWRSNQNDQTFVLSQGYLLQRHRVFPVKLNFEQGHYMGMLEDEFLKELKSAVDSSTDVQ